MAPTLKPERLNRSLRLLYEKHLYGSKDKLWWQQAGYSPPLLVPAFPEYCGARTRLAFIGQQTKGWSPSKVGKDPIQTQLDLYEGFVREGNRQSPFWTVARSLAERINGDRLGMVWTNLYRWDDDEGTPDLPRAWRVSRAVLGQELRILDPQVLVFAVGKGLTWELRDFLEVETAYGYEAVEGSPRILGRITEGGRLRGLHMVHPGARIPGRRQRFADAVLRALPLPKSSR